MNYKMMILLWSIIGLLLIGCSKGEDLNRNEEAETDVNANKEQTSAEDNEEETDSTEKNIEEPENPGRIAQIYYIDDQGAMVKREAEIENEQDIWKEMQKDSILTDECELLSFQINEENKTIDLDFNKALGDRIRSMGTTGETEILACITNTYLDSYECEKIKLTEEGQDLSTSHGAAVTGYIERIPF